MKIAAYIFFLILFSMSAFGGSKHITPADKEKIFRHVGESVFVECKNQSPFSTNCQVDCGNGIRYRAAKGYCHYLTMGNYILNVSARYRGQDIIHTAIVSVDDNIANEPKVSEERPVIEKKVESSLLPEGQLNDLPESNANISVVPLVPSENEGAPDQEGNDSTQDFNKGVLNTPAFGTGGSAGEIQQNDFQQNRILEGLNNVDLEANKNTLSDPGNLGQINNQFNNDNIQNTIPPGGGIPNNAENLNNQNQFGNQNFQR